MSVEAIINELGGTAAVAEAVGTNSSTVCNWRTRKRIPADWWPALVRFGEERGKPITFDRLAEVQAPRAEARA
jgi:hypothetical protein